MGGGADLELCLAILSAMQAWPVLEGKKKDSGNLFGDLVPAIIEGAIEAGA